MKEQKQPAKEPILKEETPGKKPEIDKRKLIIYSEIMKPKFDEGLK